MTQGRDLYLNASHKAVTRVPSQLQKGLRIDQHQIDGRQTGRHWVVHLECCLDVVVPVAEREDESVPCLAIAVDHQKINIRGLPWVSIGNYGVPSNDQKRQL